MACCLMSLVELFLLLPLIFLVIIPNFCKGSSSWMHLAQKLSMTIGVRVEDDPASLDTIVILQYAIKVHFLGIKLSWESSNTFHLMVSGFAWSNFRPASAHFTRWIHAGFKNTSSLHPSRVEWPQAVGSLLRIQAVVGRMPWMLRQWPNPQLIHNVVGATSFVGYCLPKRRSSNADRRLIRGLARDTWSSLVDGDDAPRALNSDEALGATADDAGDILSIALFLEQMKFGISDALEKGWLAAIRIVLFVDRPKCANILDQYTLCFRHSCTGGKSITDLIPISVDEDVKIYLIDVESLRVAYYGLTSLILDIVHLSKTMAALPKNRFLGVDISYTQECPGDYTPPAFFRADDHMLCFPLYEKKQEGSGSGETDDTECDTEVYDPLDHCLSRDADAMPREPESGDSLFFHDSEGGHLNDAESDDVSSRHSCDTESGETEAVWKSEDEDDVTLTFIDAESDTDTHTLDGLSETDVPAIGRKRSLDDFCECIYFVDPEGSKNTPSKRVKMPLSRKRTSGEFDKMSDCALAADDDRLLKRTRLMTRMEKDPFFEIKWDDTMSKFCAIFSQVDISN